MELAAANMLKDGYEVILKNTSERLRAFFKNGNDIAVKAALRELSDDPYIDIIYLHYRDEKTLEFIAEILERDVRTILRNKKRLVNRIAQLIEF